LTYGPGADDVCSIKPLVVGYARFSNTYQNLRDYLENLPAATVLADKASLQFTSANKVAPAAQTIRLTTQSGGTATYKLRADASWLQLSTVTGSLSANAPAQVNVTVDASQFDQPGQYSSTITILSGSAAPQFITVKATMTQDQSNVVASISPSQVQQTGGQWSFTIRLAETAGAATRITAMKLNGTDYSSNIKSWFGTDRIAAKGTVEAPLQGEGKFPAGAQYFEFSGMDEGSGQHWYRTATVTFQ
jgi:hypothetical protein